LQRRGRKLKKITIVYLPDGVTAIRRFSIPYALIGLTTLLVLIVAAFLIWAARDYFELRKKVPENLNLLEENKQYRAQLTSLAGRIDQMNKRLAELQAFENKLKGMVRLDAAETNAEFSGIGGSGAASLDAAVAGKASSLKLASLMNASLDNINNIIVGQTQEKNMLLGFIERQTSQWGSTPSLAPTGGWISSRFGYRISPFTNRKEFHSGLDISSRPGTGIEAPADGVVSSIIKSHGLGLCLTINHGNGFQTRYGHLSSILVAKGQHVRRAQEIALMGNSGLSTGTHLHYEVFVNGAPVNPEKYILN
jgi:murein DD-endopeptidase MepM/ murein hydrolase activator NlpD